MKIEVLGTGCPKCRKVYENAQAAVAGLGRSDVEVVKVEKIVDITARGVMMTPALIVNNDIKCVGKVPSSDEITEWIKAV